MPSEQIYLEPIAQIGHDVVLTRGVRSNPCVYSIITHIADQHKCTKIEAEKVIDKFTSSVIDAIGQDKEISLIGFGNFTVSKVAARNGRNPSTGAALKIAAYNQPKFKVGSKLKEACNK